jgi:protein SCO1/2
MPDIRRPSRATAIVTALVAAAVIGLGLRLASEAVRERDRGPGATTATGAAQVGGSFTLVDQTGAVRTEADFRGAFMLVYFGYTFCPDVCPVALSTMGAALDSLGERGADVTPVFITVDPARDTVARLKDYAAHFHPRLVALTGTAERVAATARAYRVYFAKRGDDGPEGDEYLVDHTSIVYLMDPEGRYVLHFTHETSAAEMVARIAEHL